MVVKTKKIILKITKYIFIVFLVSFTILFISLYLYSKQLDFNIPQIRNINIYDNQNNLIVSKNNNSNANYKSINEISDNVIKSFICIEDKSFYTHQGINLKSIVRAIFKNIKDKNYSEGASTITQQYVKNIFLTSDKTFKRKIKEALISINLENKYSKDEILESYLNIIYFDHGIYGVGDAALFYFNKDVIDLDINEAALLSCIPKSPTNYSPIKNYENADKRRKVVLGELLKDNVIDETTYNKYIDVFPNIYGKLNRANLDYSPYYIDKVVNIINNEFKEIDNKNINVYTNINTSFNKIINEKIKKYKADDEIQISIILCDTKGNVLSYIGGSDYLKSTYNRCESLRMCGSVVKPFLYYCALNNGFNVSTCFKSEKTTFQYNHISYSPQNYNDIYPNQDVSLVYALATSDNIYAMKTHLFLGIDKLYNTLKDFKFTSKIESNMSLALGSCNVTLSQLCNGYVQLASLGKDTSLSFIDKITDDEGKILFKHSFNNSSIHNEMSCYLLSEAMTNVFNPYIRVNISPTCASISSLVTGKYACKTGSTDYDNYIIGYNKDYVLGIWTGYDDNKVLKNVNGKYIKYIWAEIVNELNSRSWYDVLDDVVILNLNPINGKIALNNEYSTNLYFDINNLPEYIS